MGCHLVSKVVQSDPQRPPKWNPGRSFWWPFYKKPTLHPTAYLLCFLTHFKGVLDSPVLKKFLLKMCVGSRSPQKACHFFSSLGEHVSKWVSQWEGGKAKKLLFFLIGPPLGAPGFVFLDFGATRASFWHLFGCPGHHFGTLGAHQNDAPAV